MEEKNFNIDLKTGVVSLFGIGFKMEEGTTKGYESLADISKKLNISEDELKENLIKCELLTEDGELHTENDISIEIKYDGGAYNPPLGYFAVLPCPVVREDDMGNQMIYANTSFVESLMEMV